MALRITNRMMAERSLQDLTSTLRRLDRYSEQLATGKRISLPSHDPTGMELAMRLRSTLFETEQYIDNVGTALNWLETTDGALDQVVQVLQRARDLIVNGATGTHPAESREALAIEMNQLIDDLINVGNTRHGSKYIFGGENTQTPPFAAVSDPALLVPNAKGEFMASSLTTGVEYKGTSYDPADPTSGLNVEIGPGILFRMSIHGDDVFMEAFDALIAARDHLWSGDTEALSGADLEAIDQAMDTVLRARAEVGGRVNRLELVNDRLDYQRINVTRLLSETEDADMAETVMKLKMEENVYRASLAANARIILPSLLDFLR